MTNDTTPNDPADTIKIINERLKETSELAKQSQEKLKNYSFFDFSSKNKDIVSSQIAKMMQEQERINRNIIQNIKDVSEKIRIIHESIIGEPSNLSQMGTILYRLQQLERNVLPEPSDWPSLSNLAMDTITTQEEHISHDLLAILYAMVEYAKATPNKSIKFPLNSNIGDSHFRFERRYHNLKFLHRNSVGIVNEEFRNAVLLIANHLYFGLILCDCLDFSADRNTKMIKHRKEFDDLENIYSKTIDIIFDNCPFKIKHGIKELFLELRFPGYCKDDTNE